MTLKVTKNTIFRALFFCVTKTRDFAGTGKIQFSMNFPDFFLKEQKSPKLDAIDLRIFVFTKKKCTTLLRALVNMEPEKE